MVVTNHLEWITTKKEVNFFFITLNLNLLIVNIDSLTVSNFVTVTGYDRSYDFFQCNI